MQPPISPVQVNFLQVDYPNYPAGRGLTVVELCREMNSARAWRKELSRRLYDRWGPKKNVLFFF